MSITFRDEFGQVVVEVDGGVQFCGGWAYFNDVEGVDYRVDILAIVEISEY